MNEHIHRHIADQIAKRSGCSGPVYRVIDAWGGYWQTATPQGTPYNFRTEIDDDSQTSD